MNNFRKLLLALTLLSFGQAQAQTVPTAKPAKKHHDHLMMHDGKMVMMHDGQATPMTETKTLPNGTQVMADGTVMMKDGKKMMLKEGEEIGTDGKMHDDDKDHHKLHAGQKHKMKSKM